MKLKELIEGIPTISFVGDADIDIKGIAYNSAEVKDNYLFVAVRGFKADGHDYLQDAVKRGAKAIIAERMPSSVLDMMKIDPHFGIAVVPNSRRALPLVSSKFYGDPSKEISVIGITGTNGKTTTAYLLDAIVRATGVKSGLIGTICRRINGDSIESTKTTPESLDLQRILREMVNKGGKFCSLEVSSHALALDRVLGVSFHTAIFSNLTRDHLDFHQDMDSYRRAKEKLFLEYGPKTAVINIDDETGKKLAKKVSETSSKLLTYGVDNMVDIRGTVVATDYRTLQLRVESPVGTFDVRSSLIGRHNVYNILASIGGAISAGFSKEDIIKGIGSFPFVPGRLESIDEGQPFTVLVDYAHTEDALENTLKGVSAIRSGRVIVVFGCGGDRDKGKRAGMGRIATTLADVAVITSDNPRSEEPMSIIEGIEAGIKSNKSEYRKIVDRREAIGYSFSVAKAGDVVVIAGKGHENYQIIGDKRLDFDDRQVAREILKEIMSHKYSA